MAFPTADWNVSLFLLLALLLVARFKKQIAAIDRRSFRDMSAGLIILTLVSIGRVYKDLGVFEQTPFLSESTFYELIHWIGIITGAAFLIGGVSSWLPLAQNSRRFDRTRINRLEFVKKTEQLIGIESRLDKVLTATLENMREHFDFAQGIVVTCSSRSDRTHLVASRMKGPEHDERLKHITFDHNVWNAFSGCDQADGQIFHGLPRELDDPTTTVPVVVDRRPIAFFLLWSDAKVSYEDEDHQDLKIATDIIARKIHADRLRLKAEFLDKCEALRNKMVGLMSGSATVKANVRAIAAALRESLPFEALSVVIFGETRTKGDRYTVSGKGSVLVEKSVDLGSHRAIDELMGARRAISLSGNHSGDGRPQLGCPLMEGSEPVGCVLLTCGRDHTARPRHLELLSYLEPLFLQLVRGERARIRAIQHERRMTRVANFTDELGRISTLQEAFDGAAAMLADELKTCMVRVSVVEDDGAFLKSRALVTPREIEGMVPVDGRMIVSLMHCHKLAIETGRQVLVNQQEADAQMSEAEAAQCLTRDLQSALIIPVQDDGRTVGVISLAEMRDWKRFRFGNSEVLFAEAVGRALALAVQKSNLRQQAMAGLRGRVALSMLQDAPVLSRMKSPLTSILGSVEILRGQPERDEDSLDRYLGIIDRSAKRIQEYITQEAK